MVSIVRVKNLVHAMDILKEEKGFTIVGLDAHGDFSIYECSMGHPFAFVIGNEHRGMRRLVKERCSHIVSIPRVGLMESLNAAVSAAIAFSEFRRRNPT